MSNQENATLTLYGKPRCVQCDATERYIKTNQISYTKIDVTQNAEAFTYVTETLGYQQAPVVVASDGKHWSGFIPDELANYV